MIKRNEFIYEDENCKVINPKLNKKKELQKEIQEYQIGNLDELKDIKLIHKLLCELVIPINEEYNFSKYSIYEISELIGENISQYENMENIINAIHEVVLDCILSIYKDALIEIKKSEIQIVCDESIENLNNIKTVIEDVNEIKNKQPKKRKKVKKNEKQ